MTEEVQPNIDTAYKKWVPVVTAICCVVSVVLFIGINTEGKAAGWDAYRRWGMPAVYDIFGGDYWGLITSNFLHVEIWHIGFNLYWFWRFGKKIEFETTRLFYGLFILSSALVSSLAMLAVTDTTGIGLSGIGYAFFGFLLIQSRTAETYREVLDKKTTNLFLLWLAVCVVLTRTGVWQVGNAAHIGGLLWGITVAYAARYGRYVPLAAGAAYLVVLSLAIVYGPFSTSYLAYEAHELHENQHLTAAMGAYRQILARDPANAYAIANLRQLELHQLQEKAAGLHTKARYTEARRLYNQILRIDRGNAWARENLSRLPAE